MKTVEEKAKAYDEALERAKKMTSDLTNLQAIREFIFPELRESEDERIRKKLIGIFTNKSLCDVYNLKSEDVLAYLERQKENSLRAKEPVEQKERKRDYYSGMSELEQAIHRGFLCAGVENVSRTIIEETAQDCLASIKPADIFRRLHPEKQEWSEVDKQCLDEAIETLESLGYDGIANNLKFIRPQPKPEWSEEDIEAFVKSYSDSLPICGEFQSYHDALVHAYRQGVVNTLESLRPQSKQELQIKEGDKVSIHCRKDRKEDIITIYDGKVGEVIHVWDAKRNPWGHIVVRLDNGCNNGFYEDELEVLNEPKWKPSKEQMESLRWIIDASRPNTEHETLCSLLNDLQKLI